MSDDIKVGSQIRVSTSLSAKERMVQMLVDWWEVPEGSDCIIAAGPNMETGEFAVFVKLGDADLIPFSLDEAKVVVETLSMTVHDLPGQSLRAGLPELIERLKITLGDVGRAEGVKH